MNNNYALELRLDRVIGLLEQIHIRLALIESKVQTINENQINKHFLEIQQERK